MVNFLNNNMIVLDNSNNKESEINLFEDFSTQDYLNQIEKERKKQISKFSKQYKSFIKRVNDLEQKLGG